jgi:hypothetical protein
VPHALPRKSIRKASWEMQIPGNMLHKVVHKRLHLYAYKMEIIQDLRLTDYDFATEMLDCIDHDNL